VTRRDIASTTHEQASSGKYHLSMVLALAAGAVGLAARYLAWEISTAAKGFDMLLVGPSFRRETLTECLFLHARSLPSFGRGCAADVLVWLVPAAGTVGNAFAAAVAAQTLMVAATGLQLATVATIITAVNTRDGDGRPWALTKVTLFLLLYFLHPVTVLSAMASAVPSVVHLLLAVLLCAAARRWKLPAVLALALLIAGHGAFACAAPAAVGCFRSVSGGGGKHAETDTPPSRTMAVAVAVLLGSMTLHAVFIGGGGPAAEPLYSPASGVFWYLEMEVFTRYRRYFALLVAAPPYILAVPVALRLRARPLHALSLMLMLVMYCSRHTSFADVVFLVAAVTALHADTIFSDSIVHPVDKSGDAPAEDGERADTARDEKHAQQQQQQQQARPVKEGAVTCDAADAPAPTPTEAAEIVFIATDPHAPAVGMRFLPLITLGVAVPMAVSGTMLHLWTTVGTGNANFLFFQGLVMWVFLATGTIEFTNATIREIND